MAYRLLLYLLLSLPTFSTANFLDCISNHSSSQYNKSFDYIFAPTSQSYSNLLQSAEQNSRFLNSTSLKPDFIVTPNNSDEIRAALVCTKEHGMQLRVKSGGHDYEGLSYLSETPFVLIDLLNFRSINIDLENETAWVQSGATIGEVYYSIARQSNVHGFPAGLCPSVGVGGHFSGGGFGTMLRKYGLAADNVLDAYFMDVNGQILDRKSMGEDLFWAIRGGGGASFGIILAWKIKLVPVPPVVTVFDVIKDLDAQSIKLAYEWQNVANKLQEDLFIRVVLIHIQNSPVLISFSALFLGPLKDLTPLINQSFPELALQEKDCVEMSWIESVLHFYEYPRGAPLEVLLNRTDYQKSSFKGKSDFATTPIPEYVFEGIRERLLQEEFALVILDPFGGKMDEIPEFELPFPHRIGNLFNIQYLVKWSADAEAEAEKHVEWIRELYEYMEPYVSSSPRAAYLNYRDLDFGVNEEGNTSYSEAAVWGMKYFKGNFERLARVKKVADPGNFFRNKQSIPLFS